jgi:hypothetical protein
VNTDPAVIGGAALGRLNSEHTPSLDALIWRARASGTAAVCAAGGLEGEWLNACQQASRDPDYAMSDQDLRVEVVPGSTPS